jgi:hypothetical protein
MRLAALSLVLVLAAGCSSGGSPDAGADELSAQAQTLVPESAEVVDVSEGACVQIDGNPACARIFLTSEGNEDERADELARTAEAAGWEVAERERRGGGTSLVFEREGYRAIAAVWTTPCPEGEPDEACADEIQVIEDF